MKGKYGGPMTVDDLYQRLYQDRQFFEQHGIMHVKATYLYFTPCDENGQPVIIGDKTGNPLDGYVSSGGYDCAAESYDQMFLEPQPFSRTNFTPK
ncbi:hypothetical protein W03_25880 [Nitrosomonas sp. PY1]|uniref:hypothetical protein n=1 Tax=Nitrosomonas sp. PY1 TaxID=1803906 RepID=UPI001FC84ACE|nr:hypothetical protein [Nitrosomonas sp. PY1]UJP00090.1 MAG: hypothetical protein LZF64_13085 [Nitrosomonas sp.]GKS70584.1 hypothetical protein W03_25880 [Nitrosomonas sp. PY1]